MAALMLMALLREAAPEGANAETAERVKAETATVNFMVVVLSCSSNST